jgi:hypothetical protein
MASHCHDEHEHGHDHSHGGEEHDRTYSFVLARLINEQLLRIPQTPMI